MDIVEVLLKLGDTVVNSMLQTSDRYSKDAKFTEESREYYQELHNSLEIASSNLSEYKARRTQSKNCQEIVQSNTLSSCYTGDVSVLKIRALIDVYFSQYKSDSHFYFFDDNEVNDNNRSIMSYLNYPYGEGKYRFNLKPIMAYRSDNCDCSSLNALVFCEEGIAFDYVDEFRVIPYNDIACLRRKVVKKAIFIGIEYLFLLDSKSGHEPRTHYVLESAFSAGFDMDGIKDKEKFCDIVYSFIKHFNPACKYVSK